MHKAYPAMVQTPRSIGVIECAYIHKSDACKVISDGHRLSDEYYRRIISIRHQFLYPTPASQLAGASLR